MTYDLRNRWQLGGGELVLSFHDGAVSFRFQVVNGLPRDGKTDLPLVSASILNLVPGDYASYTYSAHMIGLHPDGEELLGLLKNPSCPDGNYVAQVDPATAPEIPAPPDFEAEVAGLAAGFPRYWEVYGEPVDPAGERTGTGYYHLGAPNRLGYGQSLAGPFDYSDSDATWQVDGSDMIFSWGKREEYRFTQPEEGARAIGRQNKEYYMVIAPARGKAVPSAAEKPVAANQSVAAPAEQRDPTPASEQAITSGEIPAVASNNEVVQAAPPEPAAAGSGATSSVSEPEWEVIGFWDYDGEDGQHLGKGLVLREKPGSMLGISWRYQLELTNHNELRRRDRRLWPVQLNRKQKRVCIDAPYPSYAGYVDTPDDRFDGVYAFASCKGGR